MVKRIWMRPAAWLVVAVSIVPALGCRPNGHQETTEVVPELKLEGVRFRVYRGDRLRVFGEAAVATLRRDSTDVTARDLVANLPRANATPVRITAPAGEGRLSDHTFTASGGVTVIRDDDVARTARARYEPDGRGGDIVRGDDPVRVDGKGYRLEGVGFTLDPATGELAMRHGAKLVAGLGEAR